MSARTFVPLQLFASGAQGAWYDPSDFSTLYQDNIGSTPVTAVEQPVGLMLDRSRGLGLGSELVTNGDFSNGTTGWTAINATHAVVGGQFEVTQTGANARSETSFSTVIGRTYFVTAQARVGTANFATVTAREGSGAFVSLASASTGSAALVTLSFYFIATVTTSLVQLAVPNTAAVTAYFDNISVRELPGNHAFQATSASRPTLRARYNLLTFSEQFDNAEWAKGDGATVTANATTAPDGTTTADQINLAASELSRVQQPIANAVAQTYTFTVWLRVASGSQTIRFGHATNLSNITVTDIWQRFTATQLINAGDFANITIRNEAGGGAKTLYIWGADLKTAADQTSTGGAYQRIAAATDYDTSNPVFRPYLAFDGTDDSFGTSSIDFSATDEMTVFAGLTKLSDAALGMFAELSTNSGSNNGTFWVGAPINNGAANYDFASGGTTRRSATTNSFAAPITKVLTGIGDISSDVARLRVNGTQVATESSDQGTGNFGNYPLFIGRRNNASLPFNGRFYSLAVLGRTATAAEITSMEAWVAGKTGVTGAAASIPIEILTRSGATILTRSGATVLARN